MITKDNIFTYAYKGLAALILSIFRKKDKVKNLFFEEDVVDENLKLMTNRLDKASANKGQEKITFNYKTKDKNGKIKSGSFDAYNIEQAKNYLINEGNNIVSIQPVKKMNFNFTLNLSIFAPIKMGELSFALTQI